MTELASERAAPPLSSDPEVWPAPLSALELDELPTHLHFVRSHFSTPTVEPASWLLQVTGAVERPCRRSLAELQQLPGRSLRVAFECAGHRRDEFEPSTDGVQWGAGAISSARWTGASLAALLADAVPLPGACEVVFEGADQGVHRDLDGVHFARSISLERALSGDVILAWEMNDEPLPASHGAPLRVIVPGCYGVDSVKWLQRIEVVQTPFTGPFQSDDYRIFDSGTEADGAALHEMRVNALLTHPLDGSTVEAGQVELAGIAWGGTGIEAVEVRVDAGPWKRADFRSPDEPWDLARWSVTYELPPGDHLFEVRARDDDGVVQPDTPTWNRLGYGNNSVHRVAVHARS